jgi:hypothetical protein
MTVLSPLRRDVVSSDASSQSEQDAQEHPLISVMDGVTRSIETRVNTVGPSESVVMSLRVTKVAEWMIIIIIIIISYYNILQ